MEDYFTNTVEDAAEFERMRDDGDRAYEASIDQEPYDLDFRPSDWGTLTPILPLPDYDDEDIPF